MQLTQHATIRSKQRGISTECINMIIDFGTSEKRKGGAIEYRLKKGDKSNLLKQLKHQIQLLDKIDGKAVLVSDDMKEVITVYRTRG
ncbi:MAG: hypothetical protein WB930_18030 [Syntrophobacteraceae bacterium]